MKVILNKDIKNLGKKFQTIEVSEGYARNYLLPKKLANLLDNTTQNEASGKLNSLQFKKQTDIQNATKNKEILEKTYIEFKSKVGGNSKLFGSITEKDISDSIKNKFNLNIDKKKIVIESQIKEIGEHIVNVKLYEGITAKLKISVVKL